MLTKDFSVEGEELTPSLKVKGKNVVVKYADVRATATVRHKTQNHEKLVDK